MIVWRPEEPNALLVSADPLSQLLWGPADEQPPLVGWVGEQRIAGHVGETQVLGFWPISGDVPLDVSFGLIMQGLPEAVPYFYSALDGAE